MRFDDFDQKMRVYETNADQCVLPDLYMVARLDGRSFTRLTKVDEEFEAPFDARFRDLMVGTTEALMQCGFRVLFGYTQSDEISLLLDPAEQTFGRKLRKFHSTLAGEASACFSLLLKRQACFDCRISQLPSTDLVVDYFRWRAADAHRNALSAWCYWTLRKQGCTKRQATQELLGRSRSDKNELLFEFGINFNELPTWQKRGVGLYWETYDKPAINPVTGATATARRRRLKADAELPVGDDYAAFISALLAQTSTDRR